MGQQAKNTQGLSQVEGWKFPPKQKNVVKNGGISKGSIFSNKFSKIKIKYKFNFSIEFSLKIFHNFLKVSQQFAFSFQTRKA